MCGFEEEAFSVIRECAKCRESLKRIIAIDLEVLEKRDNCEKLENDLRKMILEMKHNATCVEYSSLNKMIAMLCLMGGKEIQAIYHLVESHAVILRLQIQHRYHKTEERELLLREPQVFGLNPSHVRFDIDNVEADCAGLLQSKLTELPQEWYMVQLTRQYEPWKNCGANGSMHPIHVTMLPTGTGAAQPYCITLPKPKTDTAYDVCTEICDILSSNKFDLEASYANNQLYWKMRERQNIKMKAAITELELTWLREWRVLLIADPIEHLDLLADLREMISKLIADDRSPNKVSQRTRCLLMRIASGACFLTKAEIALAVNYLLPLHEKLCANIIYSIYGKLNFLGPLRSAKRKTLVLIVDENMDHISFESMEILRDQPVTRFPSLHMAYALFKEHEMSMEEGCKIVNIGENIGSFIVNPSGNLPNMEKRMKSFIEYWLPNWTGIYNVEPDEQTFENALMNYDLLMYNGHGSGIQYLAAERIEKLRVKSTVLLYGCGSVKLLPVGGRFPPYGVSNQYLMACSPCVLGMLWEVTDGDVDRMTTSFMSNWIPSTAPRPWSDVDVNKWSASESTLEFKNETNCSATSLVPTEPEMLRAVASSRGSCNQYMTAAACVVRGLPIKLR